jgi:hypothetical protein
VREVKELVKRFSAFYPANRHKMAAVTPAVHAAEYSADDGFDRRPMLYRSLRGAGRLGESMRWLVS